MKREQKQAKEALKITCFYQKDGADAQKLVKQSFQIFVKSELVKQCA